MIPVPEGMQQLVNASVARCDQQLLSRQEEVLVRLVQQRVAEEVRAVQGAEDLDHPADDLVQKVGKPVHMCVMLLTPILQERLYWDYGMVGWARGCNQGSGWSMGCLVSRQGG